MDIKYILKTILIFAIFIVFILLLHYVNGLYAVSKDEDSITKKIDFLSLLEGMENNSSIITNKEEAFCEHHRGRSLDLEQSCNRLTEGNCNKVGCCGWASPGMCVAGGAKGPTFNSDKQGKTINLDYYYYQGKCIGKGCPN
jgi:hypothetical protein